MNFTPTGRRCTLKQFVFVVLSFALASAMAQAQVDHFRSSEECVSSQHIQYHPSVIHPKPLAAGETIQKIQTDGCYEMALPDRLGGRGWVWLGSGTEFVIGPDKQVRRLAECGNTIFDWKPILEQPTVPAKATIPIVDQSAELVAKITSGLQTKTDCQDLAVRSMTTPAKGILRDQMFEKTSDCGGVATRLVDHQQTIEDAKRDIALAKIEAKARIKIAQAEAKAKQPQGCGLSCMLFGPPMIGGMVMVAMSVTVVVATTQATIPVAGMVLDITAAEEAVELTPAVHINQKRELMALKHQGRFDKPISC